MLTLEPRKTLVEQTYDALVDAICIGALAPGERLTEDALAARLNVSRQPVNAALAMLRANHLVEATGRRGVVVSRIDPVLYRNIYDFRSVVEPLAVELAGEVGDDCVPPCGVFAAAGFAGGVVTVMAVAAASASR